MKIKIILNKRRSKSLLESNSGSKIEIGDPADFEKRMSELSSELSSKGYPWVRTAQALITHNNWVDLAEGRRSEFYKQIEINNPGFETQDVFYILLYDTSNIQNKSKLSQNKSKLSSLLYYGGYMLLSSAKNNPDIQESLNMMQSSIGPGRVIIIAVKTSKEGKKGELVKSAGFYLSIDGSDFALFIPTDWSIYQ